MSNLKAIKREGTTTGSINKLRASGFIPAVLYGGRSESVSLVVNPSTLEKALKTEYGKNQVLDLTIKNGSKSDSCRALAYVISRDAVSQRIIHVDFFRLEKETKVRVSVPIVIEGVAPGVKKGGVFLNRLKQVKIEASADCIPVSVVVDISNLELGDVFRVEDVDTKGQFTMINFPKAVIAKVEVIRVKVDVVEEDEEEDGETAEGEDSGESEPAGSGDSAGSEGGKE